MKRFFAFDWVILGYLAILSAIVLAVRPEAGWVFFGYHVLGAVLIVLVATAADRYGGRFWTFARYWYVIPVILGSFRELHYLVPRVHPFADRRGDAVLAELDGRWFGDVDGFFLALAQPLVIDAVHLCYWSYYFTMLVLGVILFAKSEFDRLREYLAALMTGFFLSYLGYFVIPAVGPHHFYAERPPELDGWILGGRLHRLLLTLEWEMPDAFPSGHTLMSLIVLVMAWRHARRAFAALLVPCLGCVWATMALRYHYVVDVVASAALLPVAVWTGLALHRAVDRREAPPEP